MDKISGSRLRKIPTKSNEKEEIVSLCIISAVLTLCIVGSFKGYGF